MSDSGSKHGYLSRRLERIWVQTTPLSEFIRKMNWEHFILWGIITGGRHGPIMPGSGNKRNYSLSTLMITRIRGWERNKRMNEKEELQSLFEVENTNYNINQYCVMLKKILAVVLLIFSITTWIVI